ncbi:hypothetical protein TorRG33x02_352850 [Trema orientale]|uniref:Uncharacterized protein n=1 Tax=Trema orientale TaxID=63057 RepID=A0A2P5ADT9_TREOI|nr:hypothetical protein TorRG33x02_352850 [Trema orientale]
MFRLWSLWVVKRSTLAHSASQSLSLLQLIWKAFSRILQLPLRCSTFSFFLCILYCSVWFLKKCEEALRRNIILKFASNASLAIDDATAMSYWESVA